MSTLQDRIRGSMIGGACGDALISDDTQMTLFTANGLLNAKRKRTEQRYAICEAYIEWYLTQIGKWSNKYKDVIKEFEEKR